MWDPTHQNFAQKFRWYAHFPANFRKFQIFLEQSIFVVQKRLIYKKEFIINEKRDQIKINQFAYVLSNLLKYIKIYSFSKKIVFDFFTYDSRNLGAPDRDCGQKKHPFYDLTL